MLLHVGFPIVLCGRVEKCENDVESGSKSIHYDHADYGIRGCRLRGSRE